MVITATKMLVFSLFNWFSVGIDDFHLVFGADAYRARMRHKGLETTAKTSAAVSMGTVVGLLRFSL